MGDVNKPILLSALCLGALACEEAPQQEVSRTRPLVVAAAPRVEDAEERRDRPELGGDVVLVGSSKTPAKDEAAKLELTGRQLQGGLLVAKLPPGTKAQRVRFPGHRVNIDDSGAFPIAFSRNAPKREKLSITLDDGREIEQVFDIAQRSYELDTVDGLPDAEVKVEGAAKRVQESVDQRISTVRMKRTDSDCWAQGFSWPARGKITSRYGQPRKLNGVDGGVHWGVDIAVPTGTAVTAPACGTVVFAEANVPLSGGTMVIDHGNGVTSSLLHLSGFTKKVGETVKQGDVVAKSGATGRATGPHLDWRMNFFEIRIDPELLAPAMK